MRRSGSPAWIIATVFIIMALPTLATWIPIVIFIWFVASVMMPSHSSRYPRSQKRTPRQNPYKKIYYEHYGYGSNQRTSRRTSRGYDEPETYHPKNYRYDDEQEQYTRANKPQPGLDNPWEKKQNSPKAETQDTEKNAKKAYKAAPLKESEKQNFLVHFIPILVGALVTSVSIHLGLDKIIASALGVILTSGLFLVMYLMRKKKVKESLSGNEQVLADGHKQALKINEFAEKLDKNPEIQWEVQEIGRIVEELFDGFVEDPSDIDRARNFIKYNLPEAMNLIEAYVKVTSNQSLSDGESAQIKKAEETIVTIRESFQKLQQDLLANDLMNLEVQSRTLKSVLQTHSSFVGKDKT
ncbi:MAG: 5-bromo-4-chloroindolyl phosphate hydrolysis family protein [Alphaproteobacteria bacterium]